MGHRYTASSRLWHVPSIESLLVTGVNGFVGRSFFKYLDSLSEVDLPKKICLVSRDGKFPTLQKLQQKTELFYVTADLEESWTFSFPATHIAHFAADGSTSAYSIAAADKFIRISVNLENWILGLNCPTVFFASSGACFGRVSLSNEAQLQEVEGVSIRNRLEEDKAQLIRSRLQAEESLLNLESSGLIDLRIARLFSFIGNSLFNKPQYAVNAFIEMGLSGTEIQINGDPMTVRSYLSEYDMADWIYKSINQKIKSKYLEIGSTQPVTILELANEISAQTGTKVKLPMSYQPGDLYVANSIETQTLLGVTETISWQNALESYITFSREMRNNVR